jgi:23S rRNA C2498 (ribose-2'-O)-methylase RlmM
MPTQNESIRDLQSMLLRQLKRLHDSLDDVTDANRAQAIVREMQEINHRIALTGSLLFAAQAEELDGKVSEVSKATRKVNAAIANLKNTQAFLEAMSEFLSLVDEAIALAKLL